MAERTRNVLVVEDEAGARELLVEYLEADYRVLQAQDAFSCMRLLRSNLVDLILLDVMLPDESGFTLCRKIRVTVPEFIPVLMVTALSTAGDRVAGLEAGADDFVTKPFLKEELLARVRSHLRTKTMVDEVNSYRRELAEFNDKLRSEVAEATRELHDALEELRTAKREVEETRLELIERLALAAEFRDPETGDHLRRMASYVYEVALALGLSERDAEMYKLAAPLHDIGKLAVRDRVLLKPERLDETEAEVVREHTLFGARVLAQPRTPLVEIAYQMARGHHERWDGKGYPDGLSGEAIPLPARVCGVVDSFDAMTSGRVYRPEPLSVSEALDELHSGAGTRFDPKVVSAFEDALPRILILMERSRQ